MKVLLVRLVYVLLATVLIWVAGGVFWVGRGLSWSSVKLLTVAVGIER